MRTIAHIQLLAFLLMLSTSAFAQAQMKFVDEMYFPQSWSKPEITMGNGFVSFVPSVPDLKKTDVGAIININSAPAIEKIEEVPIIERLAMIDYQPLKSEFKFTQIADAKTPSGVEIKAEAMQGDKTYNLIFQPGDTIYLKNVPYKIKDVRRDYEPEQEDLAIDPKTAEKKDLQKEGLLKKEAVEAKEAVILETEDGKEKLNIELNKNILPVIFKVQFGDIYDKKTFFAPCPGTIKIQDVKGNIKEVYRLVSIEKDILLVQDSKDKAYKFSKTKFK